MDARDFYDKRIKEDPTIGSVQLMDEYAKHVIDINLCTGNPSEFHIPVVSNSAYSFSFKEVKDIWNAAEKYLLHETGEICKGDANYEEDTPDLNTYYERHYY